MIDSAPAAWSYSHITGMLLMDIKGTFPSVATRRLVNMMNIRQMDCDLRQWTESLLLERTVEMIIKGHAMDRYIVGAVVPHGSPVPPILFAIYTSGLIKCVKQYESEATGLSTLDHLGWVATGSNVNHVVSLLDRCAAKCIKWGRTRGLQFDTAKTEAAPWPCTRGHRKHLRPNMIAIIKVGNGFLRFNTQVTRWLGVGMDAHLTF